MEIEKEASTLVFLTDSKNIVSYIIKKPANSWLFYYLIISLAFFKAFPIPLEFDPPAVA